MRRPRSPELSRPADSSGADTSTTVIRRPAVPLNCRTPFRCGAADYCEGHALRMKTWGALNPQRDNAVLVVHRSVATGARPFLRPPNPAPGWWEGLIGPGPRARYRRAVRGVRQFAGQARSARPAPFPSIRPAARPIASPSRSSPSRTSPAAATRRSGPWASSAPTHHRPVARGHRGAGLRRPVSRRGAQSHSASPEPPRPRRSPSRCARSSARRFCATRDFRAGQYTEEQPPETGMRSRASSE